MNSIFLISAIHRDATSKKSEVHNESRLVTVRAIERWENEGGKVPGVSGPKPTDRLTSADRD